MVRRLLFPALCFFIVLLAVHTGRAADTERRIPGDDIRKALHTLFDEIKDRPVAKVSLEETLEPGVRPIAERYPEAIVRLADDLSIDSLLARPEINTSVFLEEKNHLTAELWKIYFEQETEGGWVAKRFKPLIRANVGDAFELSKDAMYAFDSLTVRRDSAEFHITGGYILPATATGIVGRAVIFGMGRFTFTAPNRVERQQLAKYTRRTESPFTESFTQLVLILSDAGYRDLIRDVALRPVRSGRLFDTAKLLLRRVEKDYVTDVGPTDRKWSFAPTHPDYLRAEFEMTSTPSWLVYSYNPFELEEVSLIQKSGFPRNFKIKPSILWCHFSRTQTTDASGTTVEEPSATALLNIQSYQIVGKLASNKKTLKLRTMVTVSAREDSVQTLTFMLNDKLKLRRVDYADGEGALLIRQGAFVSVPLLKPLERYEVTRLTLWYEGDIVRQLDASFFAPLRNEDWLPQHSNREAFVFDMEMHTPKDLSVITTGIKALEYEDEANRVTRWQALQPITLMGLTFSQHRTVAAKAQGVDVTLYTAKDLLRTSSREKDILKLVDETLPFFTESFGEYPYKKLDIVQMPDNLEYGQGFPALLMLWGLYFRSDYFLDRDLSTTKFYNVKQFFKGFLAHELAHQWWGNVVVPKTYRDAWLAEGMATYAADLFIEKAIGQKEFFGMLESHIEQARYADKEGAIALGSRLRQYYQPVVYDKGAMVLHMLRQVCGDELFYKILSTFYQTSFRKLITTEDFQRTTEEVTGRDMDWFFDQWVRDIGYPVYRTTFTSRKNGNSLYSVQCTISQEQEGRIFTMPVPVRIELKNGETVETVIWNDRKYHTFEIVTPDEVKKIETAPNGAVYCGVTG
ncbi:MAG: hypothetical protein FJY97_13755 [candidate division Zixibacteria bacterium]|nr:hypothetical protein [candidate division Zixibacteria bacterium]